MYFIAHLCSQKLTGGKFDCLLFSCVFQSSTTLEMATQEHVYIDPKLLRQAIREKRFLKPTSGQCAGYLQANMVILPKSIADDFSTFCAKNNRPCPVIATLPAGVREASTLAPGSDVATDLPRYRVFRNGELIEERDDVSDLWRDDLVTFLIGCSFSFEEGLIKAGVPVRNIEQGRNVSMYKTNIKCESAGPFNGPLVVSYRPIPKHLVDETVRVTNECGAAHGPPIHVGDPATIGINDINKPDFGDAVEAKEGDVPVFWACGVTAILGALSSKADLIITHAPGYMFVSDKKELNFEN